MAPVRSERMNLFCETSTGMQLRFALANQETLRVKTIETRIVPFRRQSIEVKHIVGWEWIGYRKIRDARETMTGRFRMIMSNVYRLKHAR